MAVDHAVMEYKPAAGNQLRWLTFEANMGSLPMENGDLLLVPCHGYFYLDHSREKAAIAHRAEDPQAGTYEVTSNYFTDMGGSDSHIDVPTDEWADRWLGTTDGFTAEGLAADGAGDTRRLGDAMDPPRDYFEEIDFMAEIQYEGSMDLPPVSLDENVIIVSWVGTQNGVMRPDDALVLDGGGDGTYARIDQATDSWGRYWFYFGVEP